MPQFCGVYLCDLLLVGWLMNTYEYTIAARVKHPSIDPSVVTNALGIEPQHSWKAGGLRRTPQVEPLEGTYRESYWTGRIMETERTSSAEMPLEQALVRSAARLQKAGGFLSKLIGEGGSIELFVGIFGKGNLGIELPAALLTRLGGLGVAVSLDDYP